MKIVQIGPVFEVRSASGEVLKRCFSRAEAQSFIDAKA